MVRGKDVLVRGFGDHGPYSPYSEWKRTENVSRWFDVELLTANINVCFHRQYGERDSRTMYYGPKLAECTGLIVWHQ